MVKVKFEEKLNDIIKEWNEEYKRYPLDEKIVSFKLIEHPDVIDSYAYVNEENKYIASIVIKESYKGDVLNGYISFIHVSKEYRHQGIGTKMVEEALDLLKKRGLPKVWLGCDYACLYSGLFIDNNEEYHKFFLNRGFVFDHNTHNLLLNKKIDTPKSLENDFKYQLLTEDLREEFSEFVKPFSRRWCFENDKAECKDIVVMLKDNEIVAFARICMKDSTYPTNGINNFKKYENEGETLGALGPLGVKRELRKNGLGREIVLYGIEELFKRGATKILVDWTSLIEFYKKVCFDEICDVYSQYRFDFE